MRRYAIYKLHVLVVQLYDTLILAHVLAGLWMTWVAIDLGDYTALLAFSGMLLLCVLGLIVKIISSLHIIILMALFYLWDALGARRWFELDFGLRLLNRFMSIITYSIGSCSFFTRMSRLFNLAWVVQLTCILTMIFRLVNLEGLSFFRVHRCYLRMTLYCALGLLTFLILLYQVL